MHRTRAHRQPAGFTLVEMVIGLAIVAILSAVALPGFSRLLAERRVLASASDYVNALRAAQVEAIRRNRPVEVLFTTADPKPAMTAAARATTSTAGANRLTRVARPAGSAGAASAADFVAGQPAVPGATVQVDAGSVTSIAFTPTGRPLDFTNATGAPLAGTLVVRFTDQPSSRKLCALLTTGGSARVCDPTSAAGQPGACPATLPTPC